MKKFLNYLRPAKKTSASLAKERLKIIVAHQRSTLSENDENFIPKLRQELITVIAKYVHVDLDQVKVELEQEGNNTVLELNITLPKETNDQEELVAEETETA